MHILTVCPLTNQAPLPALGRIQPSTKHSGSLLEGRSPPLVKWRRQAKSDDSNAEGSVFRRGGGTTGHCDSQEAGHLTGGRGSLPEEGSEENAEGRGLRLESVTLSEPLRASLRMGVGGRAAGAGPGGVWTLP